MKVLHICNYDGLGGAGNASIRLRKSLSKQGVLVPSIVREKLTDDPDVIGMMDTFPGKVLCKLRTYPLNKVLGFFGCNNRSVAIFNTSLLQKINSSDADVVHMHWINAEMISIKQIVKITKPLVWTFHDMWPICGGEHYSDDNRYIDGYFGKSSKSRKLKDRFTVFLDNWIWQRKRDVFNGFLFHIITPGSWMTECVKRSYLFRNYSARTIPNCLDVNIFRPLQNRSGLRIKYNLPQNKKIILFGAYSIDEPRKGGDLLDEALRNLKHNDDCILAIFGRDGSEQVAGIETYWLGRIDGDIAMAEVCNCADVVCVPSRQETFGQTASEPMACGIPVVAFDATGLKDVIDHKINGYLAEPFDPIDFFIGIDWILKKVDQVENDGISYENLCLQARDKAARCFCENVVAKQHIEVYQAALDAYASRLNQ